MRIEVTEEHIRNGRRCFCWACPVALAIASVLPGGNPWVGPFEIFVRGNGRTLRFEVPEEVAVFVAAFDMGVKVRPFAFELPLPTSAA